MLTRAVRRRQHLRHAQHVAEHIQLPWLCPALRSSHTTQTNFRSSSTRRPVTPRPLVERTTSAAAPLSTHSRWQASAAPSPALFDTQDGYSPFDYTASRPKIPQPYEIQPLGPDMSRILMLDHTTATGPPPAVVGRKQTFIRGNAWEVEATLDACLQIHRWDRAQIILGQLRSVYDGDEFELQRLYNKYLEAMVYDHIYNRSTENITKINTWVEGVMKKVDVPPNAQTFALKIKAAMATLQGPKRDRTVRRYWDMAKEYNVDWEVASLREILSDSDLGKLSEISPLKFDIGQTQDLEYEENDIAVSEDLVSQPALARVREADQKGLGLISLRKSLSALNDANLTSEREAIKNADSSTRDFHARQRQLRLEEDALASATERWKIEHAKLQKMGIAGNITQGKLGSLMWSWHEQLTERIKAELMRIQEAEAKTRKDEDEKLRTEYGPFLGLLDPNTLAALTVTSAVHILLKNGADSVTKLVGLLSDMGRAVESEVQAQHKAQYQAAKKASVLKALKNKKHLAMHESESTFDQSVLQRPERIQWSSTQCTKLGSVLCELLFDVAKMKVTNTGTDGQKRAMLESAFDKRVVFFQGRRTGVVAMHADLVKTLSKEPLPDLLAKQLPMICPPQPWTGFSEGGYLQSRNDVLRVKYANQAQMDYTKAAAERGDLDEVFSSLDVLGQTGWRINRNVFQVMVDAWNSGEAVADLPPVEKVFPEPSLPANATLKERLEHHKQMRAIKNERGGLHSQRCFQNFQMETARSLIHETFYLPHNVDFRGRAYPIPPYLNQMGADNVRGLLMFEKGRPLGEQGFTWLKVHLANVCGYDKASLTDRAQFANDHLDDIRDSVHNPLNGRKWWLKAEDPWQCLATCHEVLAAIDSGHPQSYVSHLPVHQDGTCNGLQHYAALGGDIAGARQVNLEPGDKPADVYTGVAELVKADIKQDAEAGHAWAKVLDGRITRKVVKQTVMTNVYGVTFVGAAAQVKKQLDSLYPDLKQKQTQIGTAPAPYIARKIFKGLGKLFEGAHNIQYWFGDCANRITNSISPAQLKQLDEHTETKQSKNLDGRTKRNFPLADRKAIDQSDFRSSVVWTTPLKLPVVQPYRVPSTFLVKTHMATLSLADSNVSSAVDKRRQLQAFPPNFIHSLDATHMMLSALAAKRQGIHFSAVHDSFWTHAADIDALNTLLRECFVRMHSEDIVGRLAAEFKLRYKGHLYLAKIDEKSPLAHKILKHRASMKLKEPNIKPSSRKGAHNLAEKRRQYQELEHEYKRQQLLASEDPKQRAEGEKMMTPARMFEEMDGEKYLNARDSLGETAMGQVPESSQSPKADAVVEALTRDEETESHDVDMESTLDPLVATEGAEQITAEAHKTEPKSIHPKRPSNNMWLWLPLTFKPVPQKGEWDVKRLRDSVYFFS